MKYFILGAEHDHEGILEPISADGYQFRLCQKLESTFGMFYNSAAVAPDENPNSVVRLTSRIAPAYLDCGGDGHQALKEQRRRG